MFGLLYLILRHKAVRIVAVPGGTWLIRFHAGVITPRGHLIHFWRQLDHAHNPYGGWWYLGAYEGISRQRWRKILKRRGRIHTLPVAIALFILLLGYVALFVPWVIIWTLYCPFWTWGWGAHALYKVYRGRRFYKRYRHRVQSWLLQLRMHVFG